MVRVQETFKALSDPTRIEIMEQLKNGRKSAGEIVANFSCTNATISHHLSILKKADLLMNHRDGKFIFYELNTDVVDEIIAWLSTLKGVEEEG